jgi:hypothetical protein
MEAKVQKAPIMLKILAGLLILLGLFAGLGSFLLWGQGFLFAFPKGVKLASPVADFFINFPLSILAGIGLWRMKMYGFVTAQFVAGFYIYASVLIFVDMFQGELPLSPEIWAPQLLAVIIALVLVYGLWPLRDKFSQTENL